MRDIFRDLRDAIDLHIHPAPDSFPRLLDDIEVAEDARARGMRAVVLKGHTSVTADRAAIASRLVSGIEVYGGVVLNLGSAVTAGGKVAAYRELSTLTQMLARRATWKQLNEHVLPRIAQQFALRFGGRLTQRKLGQLVPVVGIGVGAVMNFTLIDSVAEAAY